MHALELVLALAAHQARRLLADVGELGRGVGALSQLKDLELGLRGCPKLPLELQTGWTSQQKFMEALRWQVTQRLRAQINTFNRLQNYQNLSYIGTY